MLNISNEFKEMASSPGCKIGVTVFIDGNMYGYDNKLIDFSINEGDSSGGISIGRTLCAGLEMTLESDAVISEQSEINLSLHFFKDNSPSVPLSLGRYFVDKINAPYRGSKTITAFDRMLSLERPYRSRLIYPATVSEIFNEIKIMTGIQVSNDVNILSNETVLSRPEIDLGEGRTGFYTFREILGDIAVMCGGDFYFDKNKELNITKFADVNEIVEKKNSFTYTFNNVEYTVRDVVWQNTFEPPDNDSVADDFGVLYVSTLMDFPENSQFINTLKTRLVGFKYEGAVIEKQGFGWYEVGDVLKVNKNGRLINILISGINYSGQNAAFFEKLTSSALSHSESNSNRKSSGSSNENNNFNNSNGGNNNSNNNAGNTFGFPRYPTDEEYAKVPHRSHIVIYEQQTSIPKPGGNSGNYFGLHPVRESFFKVLRTSFNRGSDTCGGSFSGGVLLNDNKIILIPFGLSTNIGIYDTVSDEFSTGATLGLSAVSIPLFMGGTLVSEDKIILTPCTSPNVGIYNPINDTFAIGALHGQGNNAFSHGILLPNGRIIFVPRSSQRVGIYNPDTDTFTSGATVGSNNYSKGVLLNNGKIIFIPRLGSSEIGIYDYINDIFTIGAAHGTSHQSPTFDLFSDGVLLPNGKIILIPDATNHFGIYDTVNNSFNLGTMGANPTLPVTGFVYGLLLPDGRILIISRMQTSFAAWFYNPDTDTLNIESPFGVSGLIGGFISGIAVSDDRVIYIPRTAQYIGILNIIY
jgi:hypothetical protein